MTNIINNNYLNMFVDRLIDKLTKDGFSELNPKAWFKAFVYIAYSNNYASLNFIIDSGPNIVNQPIPGGPLGFHQPVFSAPTSHYHGLPLMPIGFNPPVNPFNRFVDYKLINQQLEVVVKVFEDYFSNNPVPRTMEEVFKTKKDFEKVLSKALQEAFFPTTSYVREKVKQMRDKLLEEGADPNIVSLFINTAYL